MEILLLLKTISVKRCGDAQCLGRELSCEWIPKLIDDLPHHLGRRMVRSIVGQPHALEILWEVSHIKIDLKVRSSWDWLERIWRIYPKIPNIDLPL